MMMRKCACGFARRPEMHVCGGPSVGHDEIAASTASDADERDLRLRGHEEIERMLITMSGKRCSVARRNTGRPMAARERPNEASRQPQTMAGRSPPLRIAVP